MKAGRGQAAIEAMLVLAAFAAAIGILASAVADAGSKAVDATDKICAVAGAEKCALLVDSVYANAGRGFSASVNCTVEGGKIILAKCGSAEARAAIISPGARASESAGVVVDAQLHYR